MCRPALALVILTLFAGCERSRSFLNMNSDSPMPFMGFELSVDANDPTAERAGIRPVAMRANDELLPEATAKGEVISPSQNDDRRATVTPQDSGISGFRAAAPSNEIEDIVVRISGH